MDFFDVKYILVCCTTHWYKDLVNSKAKQLKSGNLSLPINSHLTCKSRFRLHVLFWQTDFLFLVCCFTHQNLFNFS